MSDFSGSFFFFVICPKSCDDMPRRPADVGLYFLMAMVLDSLEELDRLASLEGDDRLLPVRAHAGEAADALLLAAHDHGADVLDLDVEQLVHRLADLDLVRVARDLEHELRPELLLGRSDDVAAGLTQAGALLGEQRALDDELRGSHRYGLSASSTFLAD